MSATNLSPAVTEQHQESNTPWDVRKSSGVSRRSLPQITTDPVPAERFRCAANQATKPAASVPSVKWKLTTRYRSAEVLGGAGTNSCQTLPSRTQAMASRLGL